jgi:Domain of unknown function (DUF5753)
MPYGGPTATRSQLEYVCIRSEQPTTEVRVIPHAVGSFPGAGHALLYAEGATPQLDTVQLDSAHGPEFTHAETQLAKYRAHLAWMANASLSRTASRDLIRAIALEL